MWSRANHRGNLAVRRKSVLIVSIAIVLIGQLYCAARAQQASRPLFVPNQLTIIYKSPKDADDAFAELRSGGPGVRGAPSGVRGATLTGFDVTKTSSTALTLHLQLPQARGSSGSELDTLQDLADTLQSSDPRIESATPVWIYYNPPSEVGRIGAKIESQSIGKESGVRVQGTRDFIAYKDGPNPGARGAPNDPLYFLQWDYLPPPRGMNAIGAWNITHGKPEIVVAVIDTGILPGHPDIRGAKHIEPGLNFVTSRRREKFFCNDEPEWAGNASDPGDDRAGCRIAGIAPDQPLSPSFHGTHVAGTIGAVGTNNAIGIAGVAWNVTIVPLRVLTSGGGTDVDIIEAMKWAAGLPVEGLPPNRHPADIINMSLGSPAISRDPVTRKWVFSNCDQTDVYSKAISEIRKVGTVVVVAAGNGEMQTAQGGPCVSGRDICTRKPIDVKHVRPAGCPGVISVAASDMHGHLAPYSNYGAVSITAPGGNLLDGSVVKTDASGRQTIIFGNVVGPDGKLIQQQAQYGGILSSRTDGYYWFNGTSMAAPHVAGAIALFLSAQAAFRHKPELIESAVRASAVRPPDGACPNDKPCGPGLLDAAKLVGSPTLTTSRGQ